jgi:glucose-6-phosphate isomerase
LSGRSIDELFAAERSGTSRALAAAGRPVSRLQLPRLDAFALGALFILFELATVLAAERLDVDPYDQPGVELGKWIAFARMGRAGFAERVRSAVGGFDEGDDPPGVPLV